MAFSPTTLASLDSGANINAGRVFIYKTADAVATVEADGYFDDVAELKINDNDIILVISTNATPFTTFYRCTVTSGDVALADAMSFA